MSEKLDRPNRGGNFAITLDESADIHQQAELLDTWDQRYCQISQGEFRGSVESVWVEGVRLFVESMNRSVLQKGDVGKDRIGIGVPLKLEGRSILCGEMVTRQRLLVFSGHSGFEYLSPDGFVFVGLEFPLDFDPTCGVERRLIDCLEKSLTAGRRVVTLPASGGGDLGNTLATVFHQLSTCSLGAVNAHNAAVLRRQFIGAILDALPDIADDEVKFHAKTQNYWRVSQVREAIEEAPDMPMSVAELALQMRISRRTLQNAIGDALGVSPIGYLRAIRLSGVRKELQQAQSVTEAATQWGFWHFGHFARDYRMMFGERPSDTFKRMAT